MTTEAKAKELRPYAEKLISKAKRALIKEQKGLLPEGQSIDVHSRRIVGREIRSKAVLQELFDAIAPVVEDRPGGYTRIVKTGTRRGDGGRTAIIELVDWSAPQDGASSLKKKRKAKPKKVAVAPKAIVEEEIAEEEIIEEDATIADEQNPDLEGDDTASEDVSSDGEPMSDAEQAPAEDSADKTEDEAEEKKVADDSESNKKEL